MTLKELHAIVRANFVCKNPSERKLQAELIEGNYLLPLLFICTYAKEFGHPVKDIADFLEISQKKVKEYQQSLKTKKQEMGLFPESFPLYRKINLVENGIRLHEFGIRAGEYFSQIFNK